MSGNFASRILKAASWTVFESAGVAALSFFAFLVLARLLDPHDFGIVAFAAAFVFFANLIPGHMFTDSLVQRRELDDAAKDTAFWATVAISLALAATLFLGAGPLSVLLGEPTAKPVLECLSLAMPFGTVGNISTALYRRDMRFRELAILSVLGRSLGAIASVAMAVAGAGIWSLVGQQIIGPILTSLGILLISSWRPGTSFSFQRLRELSSFGSRVSAAQIITGASEQLLNLVTGALFGPAILGYLNLASRTIQMVRSVLSSALYQVGFSAFSRLQDDKSAVKRAFLQATQLVCLAGFGVTGLLVALATPLVGTLFGASWLPSGILLHILAIELFPAFFAMFFSASYRALGRPEIVIWMSSAYLVVGLASVAAFSWAGIATLAAAWTLRAFILMPFHLHHLRRLIGLQTNEVFSLLWPIATAAAVSAGASAASYEAARQLLAPEIGLAIAVFVGFISYLAVVWATAPALLRSAVRVGMTTVKKS